MMTDHIRTIETQGSPANRMAQLREGLVAGGTPPEFAAQIVDLAHHAADEATAAFHRILSSSANTGVLMQATFLGVQIVADRMAETRAKTEELVTTLNAAQPENQEAFETIVRSLAEKNGVDLEGHG